MQEKVSSPIRFALVTGASSGIGRQISIRLVQMGYNLVAVSNQPSQLEELKDSVERHYPVKVLTLNQDLALEKAAHSVFEFCKEHQYRVEVLVNNAGIMYYGEMVDAAPDRLRSLLFLHMNTPAMLCHLFGEQMKRRGKGYILNVSSISAVMPYPTISLYGPTKAFLRHFTRAVRTELRPYGIHVTCLMPGATDTSLNHDQPFSVERGKKFGLVKKPEAVALAGIRALFRDRPLCIPGMINKLTVCLLPLIPGFVIQALYRWIVRRRERTLEKSLKH